MFIFRTNLVYIDHHMRICTLADICTTNNANERVEMVVCTGTKKLRCQTNGHIRQRCRAVQMF